MALLASMISTLVTRPNPRMVVTTHFLELFECGLLGDADSKLLKFRMDYILPKDDEAKEAAALGRAKPR